MPVIGLKFTSIDAKRNKDKFTGEIKINSVPKVTSVKEMELDSIDKKALSLGFEFMTEYGPEIGQIKINGEVIYFNEKEKADILKVWKKDKKLPEGVNVEIINHLFRQCLLKISYIADDLQLPPPLNFPFVKPKQEQQASYIG